MDLTPRNSLQILAVSDNPALSLSRHRTRCSLTRCTMASCLSLVDTPKPESPPEYPIASRRTQSIGDSTSKTVLPCTKVPAPNNVWDFLTPCGKFLKSLSFFSCQPQRSLL